MQRPARDPHKAQCCGARPLRDGERGSTVHLYGKVKEIQRHNTALCFLWATYGMRVLRFSEARPQHLWPSSHSTVSTSRRTLDCSAASHERAAASERINAASAARSTV